jgi:hypothetical protein
MHYHGLYKKALAICGSIEQFIEEARASKITLRAGISSPTLNRSLGFQPPDWNLKALEQG